MFIAVALPASEVPDVLLDTLADRIHTRGGEREVRFDWRAAPAILPLWLGGRLRLVKWGNRDRAERKLPPTAWTRKESVEQGKWSALEPEPVEVPAAYGLTNRVWFKVTEGFRGLLVRTPAGEPVVYMVCEPSTRYFRVMTRSEWMPVLIGEEI